jgi:hypothetical protein
VLLLQSSNSINYKFSRVQGIAALGQRLQIVCQYVKSPAPPMLRARNIEIACRTPDTLNMLLQVVQNNVSR